MPTDPAAYVHEYLGRMDRDEITGRMTLTIIDPDDMVLLKPNDEFYTLRTSVRLEGAIDV